MEANELKDEQSPLPISSEPVGDYEEMLDLLRKIKKERGKPLFAFITDFIDDEVADEIYKRRKELKEAAKSGNIDILIHSPGGSLGHSYIVARLLANCTDNWEALVPELAASGATLICLGSSNIVMSEISRLSPLDPQVISKRREKFFEDERQSPLEAFQATRHMRQFALSSMDVIMHFLSDLKVTPRLALETASKMAISLVDPILRQIEPYDLGAFALDSRVATEYCSRISDPTKKTKKTQRGVDPKALVEKYPAHEFIIDLEEARALNFKVSEPEPAIETLFDGLRPYLERPSKFIGMIS